MKEPFSLSHLKNNNWLTALCDWVVTNGLLPTLQPLARTITLLPNIKTNNNAS